MFTYPLKKGFTLIEIIVVMAIIVIFITVSTRTYSQQVRERQLKKDADLILNELDRMKMDMIARDVNGDQNCALAGRVIFFTIDASDYIIRLQCGAYFGFDRQGTLENSVIGSGSSTTVQFTYPYGTASTNTSIIIKHNSSNRCIQLQLGPNTPAHYGDPYDC